MGGVGGRRCGEAVFNDSLAENYEFDVADDGDAAPGYGGGPEGGVVGDAAGDGGEVRVRGGEEVQADVGGEDFGGEGGGEEGREAGLDGTEGYIRWILVFCCGCVEC